MKPAEPSIAVVLDAYREARPDDADAALVTDLLAGYLDSYGHTMLGKVELDFWEERYNADEEQAASATYSVPRTSSRGWRNSSGGS
jgi:hypothetical protein